MHHAPCNCYSPHASVYIGSPQHHSDYMPEHSHSLQRSPHVTSVVCSAHFHRASVHSSYALTSRLQCVSMHLPVCHRASDRVSGGLYGHRLACCRHLCTSAAAASFDGHTSRTHSPTLLPIRMCEQSECMRPLTLPPVRHCQPSLPTLRLVDGCSACPTRMADCSLSHALWSSPTASGSPSTRSTQWKSVRNVSGGVRAVTARAALLDQQSALCTRRCIPPCDLSTRCCLSPLLSHSSRCGRVVYTPPTRSRTLHCPGRVQLSFAGRVSCRSLVLHHSRDRFPTCPQQQSHVLDATIASAACTMCP